MNEQLRHVLFEDFPIPLIEADVSDVKVFLDGLQESGVADLGHFFETHPEILRHCASMIKITDVNRAALNMYHAGMKQELLDNFPAVFCEETYAMFREELMALAESRTTFEAEAVNQTLEGTKIQVLMRGYVLPPYDEISSKILIFITDITGQKQTESLFQRNEEEITALRALAHQVCANLPIDHVVKSALDGFVDIVHPDRAIIFLREGERLILKSAYPDSPELCEEMSLHKVEECLCGLAASDGTPRYSSNINSGSLWILEKCKKAGFQSSAALPLICHDESIGVLALASIKERDFSVDADLLETLSKEITIGIQNAILYGIAEEREEFFRTLIDTMPDTVCFKDAHGRWLVANDSILKLFQLKGVDYHGKKTSELTEYTEFYRDLLLTCEESDEEAWRGGKTFRREEVIPLPDGPPAIFDIIKVPLFHPDGSRRGIVLIGHDITERRQAEKEILKSKALLQSVFDGISEPMIVMADDMTLRLINKAALKYYQGATIKDFLGKPCYELLRNRTSPCEGCKIHASLVKGQNVSFERKGFMNPDRLERVDIYFLDEHENTKRDAVIRISDITEAARMEQELVQADKMISLGILVSGMAHEINNPNNSIMLNTSILRETWENILPIIDRFYGEKGDFAVGGLQYGEIRNGVPELFSGIERGAKRIRNIVRDLKDYSRVEASEIRSDVDINEVLRSALMLVKNMIKICTRNFSVEYGNDLPLIRGNAQRLEQVMINLIQNGCQALADKEKGLRVTTFYDDESGHIAVEVEDEGIGIPDDALPHIMDPFFTTRRGEGGTGLGLAVSAKIVREHGGIIDVKSQPGKGSTFKILLPTPKKKRLATVLVAEDDDKAREILTEALRTERYLVEEAANGTEACVKLGRDRPDLLILDIHMPNMDGVEVCRVIKETRELSGIKVIVVTGFPDSPKVREIEGMGFKHILYKPVRLPDLLKAMKNILEEGPTKSE
jgi:PAS domain S-box-containing protein